MYADYSTCETVLSVLKRNALVFFCVFLCVYPLVDD